MMDDSFESFNENDSVWLAELETKVMDLENELFDWREARTRELAESGEGWVRAPGSGRDTRAGDAWTMEPQAGEPRTGGTRTSGARTSGARANGARANGARSRQILRVAGRDGGYHDGSGGGDGGMNSAPPTSARPSTRAGWAAAPERTQALIDQGRRTAGHMRVSRGRKITIATAALLVVVTVMAIILFRKGASWPPSVAVVQSEITTACQNPNVASEPGQVNFACGKDTSQILWVFGLMTSTDNPNYTDAKTGRKGLEPIAPTQGGEVAWSLDLHHPYNPYDPVDSLAVAARAINNIIAGATLTSANGNPAVQPGLESNPANCARYTGSSAVVSHAGFPSLCAQPVTSQQGQAALVADVYQQWVIGATPAAAHDVSVLFENANNPGNPEVQAILKTLPGSS
jgi:hypothetical protein